MMHALAIHTFILHFCPAKTLYPGKNKLESHTLLLQFGSEAHIWGESFGSPNLPCFGSQYMNWILLEEPDQKDMFQEHSDPPAAHSCLVHGNWLKIIWDKTF